MRIERAVENVRRTVHAELKRERVDASGHNHAVEAGIERAVVSGIGRALALYQTHEPLTDTDGEADSPNRVRGSKPPDGRTGRAPVVTVNGLPTTMVRTQSTQSSSPLAISTQPGSQPADLAGTSPGSATKTRSGPGPGPDGLSASVGTSTGDEQYVSAPDAESSEESDAGAHGYEEDAPLTASLLAQPHHTLYGPLPPSRNHGTLLDQGDLSADSPNHSHFTSRGTISQDLSLPIPPWHTDASADSGSDDGSVVS